MQETCTVCTVEVELYSNSKSNEPSQLSVEFPVATRPKCSTLHTCDSTQHRQHLQVILRCVFSAQLLSFQTLKVCARSTFDGHGLVRQICSCAPRRLGLTIGVKGNYPVFHRRCHAYTACFKISVVAVPVLALGLRKEAGKNVSIGRSNPKDAVRTFRIRRFDLIQTTCS